MNTSAKRGVKGLRDIGTVRTVVQNQQKHERSHMVGRFARLDAERTRLEREIAMWSSRKTIAEVKLEVVVKQIDTLRPMLLDNPTTTKPPTHGRGKVSTEVLDSNGVFNHSVSLNY
ncbi:hypothetical protein [Octadecabacter antarcticus]|uniref:hypothetical protein n=1 Tax=Octadecabacter antarcticus TaxID=1217908 RepID=UPI0011818818|nr:hypothetical protein [Octadecabacter antarcticus]